MGLFNKNSRTLVFDLHVTLDLKLTLAIPDKEGESGIGKFGNRIKEFIMNGSDNCPNYMDKVKGAFSGIPSLKKAEKKSDNDETDYSDVKKLLAKQTANIAKKTRKGREKKFENFDSGLKSRIEARKKGRGTLKKIPKLRKTGRNLRVGGRRKTREKEKKT